MTPWGIWASGALTGVHAPINAINGDTLWAWSGAESLPRDRMSWCNPCNTTEPWPGAVNMNSIGVKRYASIKDGCDATVATLLNGHYPVILANLRASIPRAHWGLACANLGTWGTGCGWLATDYGPPSDSFGGNDMEVTDPNFQALIYRVAVGFGIIKPADVPASHATYVTGEVTLPDILSAVSGGVAPVDISGLVAAIAVLDGKVNRILKELNTP